VKRVVFEPPATKDLNDAGDWYDAQRPGLGAEFLAAVEVSLRRIAELPQSFPVVRREARKALLARRFPYFILFVEASDRVLILGVFHTARDPNVWSARIP
jgi:plasmid stabilization system protein ParE